MAYFEKLKSGNWRAQIRRTNMPSVSKTFRTKREAKDWANQTELKLVGGRFVSGNGTTIEDVFRSYANYRYTGEETKRRSDIIRMNRLIKDAAFMVLKPSDLNHFHIREWQAERLAKVSRGSVRREMSIVSAALNYGRDHLGLMIQENIIKLAGKPESPPPRSRSVEQFEIEGLWKRCGGPVGSTTISYIPAIFEFCCETAMRKGEALALKRCDIHEQDGLMWGVLHTSKNGSGRTVPFSARAKEIFQMLPVKTTRKRGESDSEFEYRAAQEPLFHISSGTLDALFRRIVRELGYKDLHFHDSRHEAALRLSKKLDAMTLAKVTGHKDLKTLLNVYYQPKAYDLALALSTPSDAAQPKL